MISYRHPRITVVLLVVLSTCSLVKADEATKAAAPYPPKLTELSRPAGVNVANVHAIVTAPLREVTVGMLPERFRDAVAWVLPYRSYTPTLKSGRIDVEIIADGPVYVAATWNYDGRMDADAQDELWEDADFCADGWLAMANVGLFHRSRNEAETHTIYARYCRAGEKFAIRTRASGPPVVLMVPHDSLTADSILTVDPEPSLPEDYQRSYTGAKALTLIREQKLDAIESWAGELLSSGAKFSSGHYRFRSLARGFNSRSTRVTPEHFERYLPNWNSWLTKYPQSNAARLCIATVLIEYSRTLRTKTDRKDRLVDADVALRRALELLFEVEQSDPSLPHMYLEYMLLAREQKWDEELGTEYFERAVKSGSWCPQAVGEFVMFLTYQHAEDPVSTQRKIQTHLDAAVAATRNRYGERLYAASIKDFEMRTPDEPLTRLGYDWHRLKRSFEELLGDGPPSGRDLRAFARLASAASDRETASRIFTKLGAFRAEDSEGWTDEVEYTLNRRWASHDFATGDQKSVFDLSAAGAVGLRWTSQGPQYLDRLGRLYSFDPQTGSQTELASLTNNVCFAYASTSQGDVTICGGAYGELAVYSLKRANPSLYFRFPKRSTITSVDISDDGNLAVVARADQISVLNLTEERPQFKAERAFSVGETTWTPFVAFTPDGRTLVTYTNNEVVLWSADSLRRESSWRAGERRATAATLSPDGTLLVTAASDGAVRFWEFPTGKPLGAIEDLSPRIHALSFSRDGRKLVVGTGDLEKVYFNDLHLIDVESRRRIRSYTGHKGSILGVDFSPDGKTLLSVGLDRSARLWDVPQ